MLEAQFCKVYLLLTQQLNKTYFALGFFCVIKVCFGKFLEE